MGNTNFQTIYPMGGIVNGMVKQATGREPVDTLDMDYVTVAQNTVVGELEFTGDVVQFETGRSVPIRKLKVNLEPIQSGSGDPSPSNVRPISGWTGANVRRLGKNLLKVDDSIKTGEQNATVSYENGGVVVTATGTYALTSYTFMGLKIGETYTLSFKGSSDGGYNRIYVDNSDSGTSFGIGKILTRTLTDYTITFTAVSQRLFLRFYVTSTESTGTMIVQNIQLELGETATAYEPYTGSTYSISWQTEAGTVYGGTLDVITGVLTVDRAYALLNDANKWSSTTGTVSFKYSNSFSDRKIYTDSYTGLICSYMPVSSVTSNYTGRWTGASTYEFGIRDSNTTLEQIKTDATAGKIAICYELATPQTYQLTPQEVSTLVGDNTIYSDAGTVDVMYWVYREMS